tara:strand:- start:172 stop:420 length:249 start_codon:yes stop_codon:yes gene_type:complete
MDADKRNLTTMALIAIENATRAMEEKGGASVTDMQDSTHKLRAHYARERGLNPPEVTLELLRKRHAERQAKSSEVPADPSSG